MSDDPEHDRCDDVIRALRKLRRMKTLHDGNVKPTTIEWLRGDTVAAVAELFDEFGLVALADACRDAVEEFDGRYLEDDETDQHEERPHGARE